MRRGNLAAIILQNITHRALQHAGTAASVRVESRGMLAQLAAKSAGFDANHAHRIIAEKRMKQSDRIRSPADAGNQTIRQPLLLLEDLDPGFGADHSLKIAHHRWIGMWA